MVTWPRTARLANRKYLHASDTRVVDSVVRGTEGRRKTARKPCSGRGVHIEHILVIPQPLAIEHCEPRKSPLGEGGEGQLGFGRVVI